MWSTSCTANYQDKQIRVYRANIQIFFILASLKWSVTAQCLPSHLPTPTPQLNYWQSCNKVPLSNVLQCLLPQPCQCRISTFPRFITQPVAWSTRESRHSVLIEYCWSVLCLVAGHLTDLTDEVRTVYIWNVSHCPPHATSQHHTLPWNLKCPHSLSNNSGLNYITHYIPPQISDIDGKRKTL